MALVFPTPQAVGQSFSSSYATYTWNGSSWTTSKVATAIDSTIIKNLLIGRRTGSIIVTTATATTINILQRTGNVSVNLV